ncbi:MAG: hypothetical protein IPK69_09050 [Phycisphaerales bacterium]|nr:MAG: hypothetical protein IPK69_09050 [Phycisphaerales bacterium]
MEMCTLRLRALHGTPLDEAGLGAMVEATARGIAERMGVVIQGIRIEADGVTITMELDKLSGLGFMAELRRTTNRWYEQKYRDGPLWGTPAPGREE